MPLTPRDISHCQLRREVIAIIIALPRCYCGILRLATPRACRMDVAAALISYAITPPRHYDAAIAACAIIDDTRTVLPLRRHAATGVLQDTRCAITPATYYRHARHAVYCFTLYTLRDATSLATSAAVSHVIEVAA